MKTPESLEALVDHGIIQEVIRPLMSGKEAQVYVVVAGGEQCVAKVYKEASQRTFKHRVEYTEGRRTRNSRDQRAISKRSRHGRKQDEAAWRTTEVDMIYRLRDAGVRVPEPLNFVDGVLVMELVKDAEGNPAPRLGDLSFAASEAREIYQQLIREVVRMLCAGVIHGDLSDFNVLLGANGPVLIDFPQSVDPAQNQNAGKLLLRDVENLHGFLARFSPNQPIKLYAQEMWSLYQANQLEPDTELRGDYQAPEGKANTEAVLEMIEDADLEEQMRRDPRGSKAPASALTPFRPVVDFTKEAKPRPNAERRSGEGRGARPQRRQNRTAEEPIASAAPAASLKKKRNRRRRKRPTEGDGSASARASQNESTKVGSGEADGAQKRRGERGRTRPKVAEAKAGGQSGTKRPAKPASENADGGQASATGAANRPPRRRRRRARAT